MTTETQSTNTIPAIDCPLSGAYLIEASAGTGKTWTLTGIILRLLIEKKAAPESIIATTFTKSAAKEIQERVFERIQEFYNCCKLLEIYPNWYKMDSHQLTNHIQNMSEEYHIKSLSDPINQYLLNYIISLGADKLLINLKYIEVLLTKVDKLFIGTLDGLAQKWLKEFVYDLEQPPELIQNTDPIIRRIIHSELRMLHSKIKHELPTLYPLIDISIFTDVDEIKTITQNALQFFSAPIDEISLIHDDYINDLNQQLTNLIDDLVSINDFYHQYDYAFSEISNFGKKFSQLTDIINGIKNHNIHTFCDIKKDSDSDKFLLSISTYYHSEKIITSKYKSIYEKWRLLNIHALLSLYDIYQKFRSISSDIKHYIIYHISLSLRHKLSEYLSENNKTTFVITMINLIHAINNHKTIKEQIRYRYPIALIDEAQDMNGEQAVLIESIYLEKSAKLALYPNFFALNSAQKTHKDKGFLLLVGDPKQAIYRFRGSDVINYNYMKNLGLNTNFTLTMNRRSVSEIIETLNQWFINKNNYDNFGCDIFYETIQAVQYDRHLSFNSQFLFHGDCHHKSVQIIKADSDEKLAYHIVQVLKHGKINGNTLVPSDIAILSATKKGLMGIQKALQKYAIDTQEFLDINIFSTECAKDIYQLLFTITQANDKNMTAFLTSKMLCINLQTAQQLLTTNTVFKNKLLYVLKKAQEIWEKYGVVKAIEYVLSYPLYNNQNIWQISSTLNDDGRYLTIIRQLLDILSTLDLSSVALLEWYKNEMIALSDHENYQVSPIVKNLAIQLMTIHASKGLEFKIVYVLELEEYSQRSFNSSQKIYAYHQNNKRRLSVDGTYQLHNQPLKAHNKSLKEIEHDELFDEKKRLAYVALTRASEQLFIVQKNKIKEKSPLHFWGFQDSNNQDSNVLPKRLKNYIDLITIDDIDNHTTHTTVNNYTQPIDYISFQQAYPITAFNSFYQASFTALTKLLIPQQTTDTKQLSENSELAGTDEFIDNAIKIPIDMVGDEVFSARFIKGVQAGIFLHKLLENITHYIAYDDTNNQWLIDDNLLGNHIDQLAQKSSDLSFVMSCHQSNDDQHSAHNLLKQWLKDIINTPFVLSQLSLLDIKNNHCLYKSELGFSLSLSDKFCVSQFIHIIDQHSDKKINGIISDKRLYYLLNGEIDLVYEAFGKYYIVDYKSNCLANHPTGYTQQIMAKSMDTHYYWLQAVIYQVALHRLLKVRLADYVGNEQRYLGGVEYMFLRGIDNSYYKSGYRKNNCHKNDCYQNNNNQNETFGQISWQIPIILIKKIDELFG